jgi:hypothetical protein
VNDAWSGPAIGVRSASEFAATIGRVWQELDSGAVEIVVAAKTGVIRGYLTRDAPPSLAGAKDMIAALVRDHIAAGREANRTARIADADHTRIAVAAGADS